MNPPCWASETAVSLYLTIPLAALDLWISIAEPDRGRRHWTTQAAARDAVYANRLRMRGGRGVALQHVSGGCKFDSCGG